MDDQRLRDRFRESRDYAERPGAVPVFEEMMARAQAEVSAEPSLDVVHGPAGRSSRADGARRDLARIGGWVSLAAAAAAVGLLFLDPSGTGADAEFERLVTAFAADAGSGAWRSPTSALLEMPGLDLGAVPSIGGAIRGLDLSNGLDATGPEGRDS